MIASLANRFSERLERMAAVIFRVLAPRVPILLVAMVYLLILLAAPAQMTDILGAGWSEDGWLAWLLFALPPAAAAIAHLALLGWKITLSRLPDTLVANLPLALMTIIVARWAPAGLALLIPVLMTSLAAGYLAIPVLQRRRARAGAAAAAGGIVLFAAGVVAVAQSPIALPTEVGPLAVLSLGVTSIGLVIATAALRPPLALLYLAICVMAAQATESRPVKLLPPNEIRGASAYGLGDGLYAWLRKRPDLADYREAKRPYPVIIASAEGGGIYAAAHSYFALTAMQKVCPSFASHLFATVGVSGGGVGNLLYSAKLDPQAGLGQLAPCRPAGGKLDLEPVTRDLLSPVLANLLFLRTADLLVPGIQVFDEGGETLGETILTVLPGNERLRTPLRAGWRPDGNRPAMIFVATDVNVGNRFLISALGDAGADGAESFPTGVLTSAMDIPAHRAAVISASFPYLTATARLAPGDRPAQVLADGGYVDNSGGDTALSLIRQIKELGRPCVEGESRGDVDGLDVCRCPLVIAPSFNAEAAWEGCALPIFIAYVPISSAYRMPGMTYGDEPAATQSYLSDPVATMLRARQTRGVLALHAAHSYFGSLGNGNIVQDGRSADYGVFPHLIDVDALGLPLGWKLSRRTAGRIAAEAAPTHACPDGGGGNGCEMKLLAWLFNPAGRRDAHAIPTIDGWME